MDKWMEESMSQLQAMLGFSRHSGQVGGPASSLPISAPCGHSFHKRHFL